MRSASLYRFAGVDNRSVAVNLLAHHAVPRSGVVVARCEQTRRSSVAEVLLQRHGHERLSCSAALRVVVHLDRHAQVAHEHSHGIGLRVVVRLVAYGHVRPIVVRRAEVGCHHRVFPDMRLAAAAHVGPLVVAHHDSHSRSGTTRGVVLRREVVERCPLSPSGCAEQAFALIESRTGGRCSGVCCRIAQRIVLRRVSVEQVGESVGYCVASERSVGVAENALHALVARYDEQLLLTFVGEEVEGFRLLFVVRLLQQMASAFVVDAQ